jgi:hypothetical protein
MVWHIDNTLTTGMSQIERLLAAATPAIELSSHTPATLPKKRLKGSLKALLNRSPSCDGLSSAVRWAVRPSL